MRKLTRRPLANLDLRVHVAPLAQWPRWVRRVMGVAAVVLGLMIGASIVVVIGLGQDWMRRHLGG